MIFRLLPLEIAPGPFNMAADETLLASALQGQAALRLYGWTEATVSLGYFQPAAVRNQGRLAALPFLRRPSGGSTLVHHHELTYCLALPAGPAWEAGQKWMPRMHGIILRALERHGVTGLILAGADGARHGDVLCFQQFTPGDVLCRGRKIVGSAQRKQRQCTMQHGGILLARSECAPELPGVRELTGIDLTREQLLGTLIEEFEKDTGWQANPSHWNAQEQASIAWLIEHRYGSAAWNEKR